MATRLLAKILMNGDEIRITHDSSAKRNPYRIIRRKYEPHSCRYTAKTEERYADYTSCLYWIAQEANLYGRNHVTG